MVEVANFTLVWDLYTRKGLYFISYPTVDGYRTFWTYHYPGILYLFMFVTCVVMTIFHLLLVDSFCERCLAFDFLNYRRIHPFQ